MVSVIRTRQASSKLIESYFAISLSKCAISLPAANAQIAARRSSSARRPRPPAGPNSLNASATEASQVAQGGGRRAACAAAQPWFASRPLKSATRKPASTITLAAMVGSPALAQVARQPFDRADQVGDLVERGGTAFGDGAGEALPHDIGFRDRAPARLGGDLGDERVRQADGEHLHGAECNTKTAEAPYDLSGQGLASGPEAPLRRGDRRL